MFTQDNTQGFSDDDLDLMNEALKVLMAEGWDEQNASDLINNNYLDSGNTVESLTFRHRP